MSHEHDSGLPYAYDRAADKGAELQGVVFYGQRPYLQGAELNDLQTIARKRHERLGRLVAKDGDRIERAEAIVDTNAGTVTLTEGSIYVAGDVHPVAAAILTAVPMVGRVAIGVRLTKSWITHEDDPSLIGLVPGSVAEGEPGAARERVAISWARDLDGGAGTFYAVYVLVDGTIIDQRSPSILEPAMQAIALYDRAHGHYVVSGCRVTGLGAQAGSQMFSIESGEANINGFKRVRLAAARLAMPEDWDEAAVPGETHTYPGGASYTFEVDQKPIGVINSILLTREKTVSVTRGAIVAGQDGLPDTSVIQIVEVKQGSTKYTATTDYIRTGNSIDWAPAGAEPAIGSTYSVTYRYRASVQPTASTDTTITVSGGAMGGDIIVAYTVKMQRIDLIGLNSEGAPVYIKGVSARSNAAAPIAPSDILPLATVSNDWMSRPVVVNDMVRSIPYAEMWRLYERVIEHDRLIQLTRLQTSLDRKDPVAKKGMFVDPFADDSFRDGGAAQTAAIGLGMMQLAITPTHHRLALTRAVTLDWIEETVTEQGLITACTKINPYANFTPLPAALALDPAADYWSEARTIWASGQTIQINGGVTFSGPLQTVTTATQVVSQTTEQAEFLRPIPVSFSISGFGHGEILSALTFDALDVKPAGILAGDANGQISGSFVIPANVPAGTKEVTALGAGGSRATALFTGAGEINIETLRRVTTITTWTLAAVQSDPQAQLFSVAAARQLVGVDIHLCAIGDRAKGLLVEQVSTENGYPTTDTAAQASVSMTGAQTGWTSARYALPVTTLPDRLHACVVKTDDADHSISYARLGDFDAARQRFVTSHPYVVGPRFSSVNASTWTAHQDEALAFRIIAARYPVTTKTVDLGTVNLVQCSDLQIRAGVELPSSACSVIFEVERSNGTIYQLLPYQLLQLPEYITETVQVRAILKGTETLSPVLFAPVTLVAGRIATEATYVTRAFALGAAVRLTAYLKAYLPGGSTLAMAYSVNGGAWSPLPLNKTEALTYALWTEQTFEAAALTGDSVRIRITATGGPAARFVGGDFGASIF